MPADAAEIVRLADELCGKDVGGSSWLDGQIAFAIGYFTPEHLDLYQRWLMDEGDWDGPVPVPPSEYSGSLDAAMTLVPEGWGWTVSQPNEKAVASGLLKEHTPVLGEVQYGCDHRYAVAAATPALALTAAALKARARAAQHDHEVG